MIPQVARRLHIFISVHLDIDLVLSWGNHEACSCWVSEQIVFWVIFFTFQDWLKTKSQFSTFSDPAHGISIKSWSYFKAMNVSNHWNVFDGNLEIFVVRVCVFWDVVCWTQVGTYILIIALSIQKAFRCRSFRYIQAIAHRFFKMFGSIFISNIVDPSNIDGFVFFHIEERARQSALLSCFWTVIGTPVCYKAAVEEFADICWGVNPMHLDPDNVLVDPIIGLYLVVNFTCEKSEVIISVVESWANCFWHVEFLWNFIDRAIDLKIIGTCVDNNISHKGWCNHVGPWPHNQYCQNDHQVVFHLFGQFGFCLSGSFIAAELILRARSVCNLFMTIIHLFA